ncbi:hypothetical protein [Streptomyces acidicola]|uniref:hypothetical protein n=1 Tax=Streptomyces acidicola TaxID=2596892 RepID=UPI00343B794C
MADNIRVKPSDLNAAGSAQSAVAQSIRGPIDRSIADAKDAAESLKGWAVGAGLQEIAESWELGLNGLYNRLDWGSYNLHSTAETHEWNEQTVAGDFERFDGTGRGGIVSAPAAAGPGIVTAAAPGGFDVGGPVPGDNARPELDDFQDARPAMPTYQPEVHDVAPAPGTTLSVDDMLDAEPAATPGVDPEGIHGGPARNEGPAPDRFNDFG